MGDNEYQEALKLGKKEYKACVSQGRFPYLPVLDDILSRENIQTEQIAEELHISPCTVNRHRENIKAKIRVGNVSEMVAYWYTNNLK